MISARVNGNDYGGWTEARVARSIESLCGSFDLAYTDRFSHQDEPWPIVEEDECTILVDDEVLITGYVDHRSMSLDGLFSVSGKDKTASLVECSARIGQWEFYNLQLPTLASKLAAQFGLDVVVNTVLGQASIPPLKKMCIDPGDTAFEVLDRACRQVGMLPISDSSGRLVLTRAGTTRLDSSLVQGENILAARAEFDATGRFHDYYVVAQHSGTDEYAGTAAAHVQGSASDEVVRRTKRALLVRAESACTDAYAKERAKWEATVRAGRSVTVTVTVQGWKQKDDTLWPVNKLVPVRIPRIGIDGDMLIVGTVFSMSSDSGTTTELTLRPPGSFKPEPVIPKDTGAWKEISGGVK